MSGFAEFVEGQFEAGVVFYGVARVLSFLVKGRRFFALPVMVLMG